MSVLDQAHFNAMTAGDETLQREVARLFCEQLPLWRAALADADRWRDGAHTIKGSARGIGLPALAAACEAAEAAPDAEREAACARVLAALDEAEAALAHLVA
jgi:HPt (histidine-containing phosphotransfer) domain-containing protein